MLPIFMTETNVEHEATPAELGFSMPAEWEKHEATWLGWPHNHTDWPGKVDTIRWVYGEMVRKIAQGEIVRILVSSKAEEKLARSYLKRAGADLGNVQFVLHPTNRGWTRDSGPIFVRRRRQESGVRSQESEERGQGREDRGGRRRLCIFISMRGPSIRIGKKTGKCRKPQPDC